MRVQIRGIPPYSSDDVVVLDNLTVAELRNSLMDRFNIDPATHSIRLLYRGRLMQDANSVSSYGVEEGSTVHIVVQPRQPEGGNSGGSEEHSAGPNQQQQFTIPQFSFSTGGGSGYNYMSGGGFSWQPFASTLAQSISTAFQHQQQTAPQGWSMPSASPSAPGNSPHVAFSYEMGSNVPRNDGTAAAGGSGGDTAAAASNSDPAMAATMNALTSQLPWLISSVLSNSLYGNAGAQPQQPQQQSSTAGATPAGQASGGVSAGASMSQAEAQQQVEVDHDDAAQAMTDTETPGQREDATSVSAPPHPSAAPTPVTVAGGAAPQPVFNFTAASPSRMEVFVGNPAPPMPHLQYPQHQPSVVHIHVHCTPEELDAIPERLRRLATQIPVGQVTLQPDTTDRSSYRQSTQPEQQQQQQQQPRTTAASQGNNTSTSVANDTQAPWINEAMSAMLATLGMPQLMQLAAGNYSVLANLRALLQEQVQRRLNGTNRSLDAMAHVAQHEAKQLSERILSMPVVQNLMTQQTAAATSAGRTIEEASQRVGAFRRELPRYLEHFYVAVMQHLCCASTNTAEWSRELRNIVVRYVGMVLSRSARWFEDGSLAFQPAMANIMQILLQSSGVLQQYPVLQTFSAMLSPMLQSLLGQWEREYDQNMRRSDDNVQFEQDVSQPSPSLLPQPQAQVEGLTVSSDGVAAAPPLTAESASDLLQACNANILDSTVSKRTTTTDRGDDDEARIDDDFEDLAKELMEDADNNASQPATKRVTPDSRLLDTPNRDPPASAEKTPVPGEAAAAAAASQAHLTSAVEGWEDACDVPHSVAERVRVMASRYVGAHAPPPSHARCPHYSTTRAESDDWVMWEASPYHPAASRR
ncbi:ubiquitin-like protein [Leishmania braziliensis MHOM/BR/75/M2904]|uniref:Ubiquitin-like protein n=2 Tax=Leishmania braziliensis TaxID=5660 RepID=A4H762_LEIBR|nr:ubiquitin-like protein [Leishmania braziliensis MHOM/BR/75/M2904]CAJ2468675.1 unnamed protein product [Leishmania braziliensis]CAJ2469208.1 unnamed protein product [Leishmania braziliensis]CAM45618.1 ubiquitin-like protein [Leishmania braziliensis MHOM/BR/75/M2904]SYZ63877.1 ubiquitin-like_protein [Leishmania braziliensis MHOM/BR/75/M2904]